MLATTRAGAITGISTVPFLASLVAICCKPPPVAGIVIDRPSSETAIRSGVCSGGSSSPFALRQPIHKTSARASITCAFKVEPIHLFMVHLPPGLCSFSPFGSLRFHQILPDGEVQILEGVNPIILDLVDLDDARAICLIEIGELQETDVPHPVALDHAVDEGPVFRGEIPVGFPEQPVGLTRLPECRDDF